MTDTEKLKKIIFILKPYFTSGNDIKVERATIPISIFEEILKLVVKEDV